MKPSGILPLLQQDDWTLRIQALTALPSVMHIHQYPQFAPAFKDLLNRNDTLAAPYRAFLAHSIQPLAPALAHALLLDLTRKYESNMYVTDAIISNLYNKEDAFYKEALVINPDTGAIFNRRLRAVIDDIAKVKNSSNLKKLAKEYPKGATLFQSVCQTCHGAGGNGITALAPPLNGSNWVQGDKNKLIPIVLYGLTGPVKIARQIYKSPQINRDMPGLRHNANPSHTH